MLNRFARALFTRLLTPVARVLLALGVSPDVVTLVGTLGVGAGALAFYPRGEFFWGTIVITAFVFSDTVDGIMARASGRSGAWGAFLDSTLDRIGDAAVFGGLVLYFAGRGNDQVMTALALACLVFGQVVSYARARAEGLGMRADVGIAERADRLVTVLVTTGLVGLGLPMGFLRVVLAVLALASLVTIAQRMLLVRRQVLAVHEGATPGVPAQKAGQAAGQKGQAAGQKGQAAGQKGQAAGQKAGQAAGQKAGQAVADEQPATQAPRPTPERAGDG